MLSKIIKEAQADVDKLPNYIVTTLSRSGEVEAQIPAKQTNIVKQFIFEQITKAVKKTLEAVSVEKKDLQHTGNIMSDTLENGEPIGYNQAITDLESLKDKFINN